MNRVDLDRLERLVAASRASPRRRMNDNLHAMEDPIHRLLNAMEPDSYVQPHRHLRPPKLETLAILRGRGALLLFDDQGTIVERVILGREGPTLLAEIPAGAWHTLVALEPGTVWFEVKAGPYAPPAEDELARFAPAPGTLEATARLKEWVRGVEDCIRPRSTP